MNRVRVGVVGLGAIAQAVHLPNLMRLWDRFEIVHVCDITADLAGEIAPSLGRRVEASVDPRRVYDDPAVDAVLILASGPHGPAVQAALEAGKHVFVEKPLALTVASARDLHGRAVGAGRVLQVGYMKLHEPIVGPAVLEIRAMRDPRLVRVTVFHPSEELQRRHLVIRRSSAPPEIVASGRAYDAEMTRHAIGDLPPILGWIYREVALGSLVHQIALLRHLFGSMPATVTDAEAWPLEIREVDDLRSAVPPTIAATGRLSANLQVRLDWVWAPGLPEYVERYEVIGSDTRLELELPTPYIMDLGGRLAVHRLVDERHVNAVTGGDHRSGFQAELEAFHAAIVAGPPFASDASDAAIDTAFLQSLVAAIARRGGFQAGGEAASRESATSS